MSFMKRTIHPIVDTLTPIVGSLCFTAFLGFLLFLLGFIYIGMGSYCMDKCNLEEGRIGIFLLINGITHVLIGALRGFQYVLHKNLSADYNMEATIEEPPARQEQDAREGEGEEQPKPEQHPFHGQTPLMKVVGFTLEVLLVFLMVWFINGCLWVYRNHGDVQHSSPAEQTYCRFSCFTFAFWALNVHFILIGVAIALGVASSAFFIWRERQIR